MKESTRIAKLRRRYIKIVKFGDGWSAYIRIGHQIFGIIDDCNRFHARWAADEAAKALAQVIDENTPPTP